MGWLSKGATRLKPILDVVKGILDLVEGFLGLLPRLSPSTVVTAFRIVSRVCFWTVYLYMMMKSGWEEASQGLIL